MDDYYGREYGPGEAPREVFTMTMEDTFFPRTAGKADLKALAGEDGRNTELLDLLLGVLFRYDP